MTINIKIPLRVASKKNNRRNFRGISLPSLAYVKFHKLASKYIKPFSSNMIDCPFELVVNYHIKGNYHQDIDNAISSVLDCLTDYGVIKDDDLCVKISATKDSGHKDWLCEISITPSI